MSSKALKVVSALKEVERAIRFAIDYASTENFIISASWIKNASDWLSIALRCTEEGL